MNLLLSRHLDEVAAEDMEAAGNIGSQHTDNDLATDADTEPICQVGSSMDTEDSQEAV